MAERVREVKREFEKKIQDTHDQIKEEHTIKADAEKKKLKDDANAKIQDGKRRVEEDNAPHEERESEKRAKAKLRDEEDRLTSARKRLENLTGKPVEIPEWAAE